MTKKTYELAWWQIAFIIIAFSLLIYLGKGILGAIFENIGVDTPLDNEESKRQYKETIKPIDTDNDGLSDEEEKQIGTNPQIYDTDGDMLSDYYEHYTSKTNPLNKNTDGDRYNDSEDPDPLKKNSADIQIQGTFNTELNYVNIGLIAISGGIAGLSTDLEIYSTNVELEINNYGDDYTSGGSFNVVLLIGQNLIDIKAFSFAKIEQNSVVPFTTTFSTKLGDVPTHLINIITQKTTPSVEIRNLDYERF